MLENRTYGSEERGTRKAVLLTVRMTQSEKDALEAEAALYGISVSQLARKKLRGVARPLPAETVSDIRTMCHEIKKQGTNINQAMHAVNLFAKSEELDPVRAGELMGELRAEIAAARKAYVMLSTVLDRDREL